jgi:hypothetical protein
MIAKGHTDQQIAGLLYIPLRGVEFERAQIMRKLEVSSTSGIVLYALETGLINPCPDEEAHPRRAARTRVVRPDAISALLVTKNPAVLFVTPLA